MKKYGTLESLAATSEADIAQTLGIKADAASDILISAKNLYRQQQEKQNAQKTSLGMPGTTKEKAAKFKINHDLAAEALLEVASPEDDA